MVELLLNGDEIPETEFDIKFLKIVGTTFKEWIKRPTTKTDGSSELYEWRDDMFVLGGSSYSNPKLYKIIPQTTNLKLK